MERNFYFTFGMNHEDAKGKSLFHNYVRIEAEDEIKARDIMFAARGQSYAFSYTEGMKADAIDRFNLKEVPLEDVTILKK